MMKLIIFSKICLRIRDHGIKKCVKDLQNLVTDRQLTERYVYLVAYINGLNLYTLKDNQ